MRAQKMLCWTCRKMRNYPDEFPVTSFAKCWWDYPLEVRVTAPEWRVPKRLRWWRSTDHYITVDAAEWGTQ